MGAQTAYSTGSSLKYSRGLRGTRPVLPRYSQGHRGVARPVLARHSCATHTCALGHACAVNYVLGTANSNACPAGSSKITTEATCEAAAKAVGKPYGGSYSNTIFPSGCYLSSGEVNLNAHPTGGAFATAQPLCRGTGAPFQPPPPRAHLRGTPWAE